MQVSPKDEKTKRLPKICIVIYILTLISALLYFAFTKSTSFADWFNTTVSAKGRQLMAALTAWLPFSLAELLILLIPLLALLLILVAVRHYCASRHDAWVFLGILMSSLCVIGILFVWLFAPGYYATTLDKKLNLQREKSSAQELYQTAELLSDELSALRDEITFLPSGASLMP